MMRSSSAVVFALWVAFVGGPAHPADLGSDHDAGTDFSAYRTYAWKVNVPEPEQDPTGEIRRLDDLVRGAADAELGRRGYRRVGGEPDMWLVYSAVAGSQAQRRVFEGKVWDVSWMSIYAAGNLVLEVLDGDSGETVWRGWASGGLKPSKREKRLPRIVRKILKRFPPRHAGKGPPP